MDNKRIFTEKELEEMGTRTLDLVYRAIDSGDKEKAKELADRMYKEFNYLHDGYMFWITGLLTHIYKKHGISAVEEAEREAHTIEGKTVFKAPELPDLRSKVAYMAGNLRGHLQPITIREDDEKISLTMKPCGSGERIIQKGGYKPEAGLAIVHEPHHITWGMKDFPIYCVHCPVMELLTIEGTGDFGPIHIVAEPINHGSCQFVFYKDPSKIPEKYYTRIGKNKPASRS
jgi:hypothetical protein